jgi:hypothetical protein
MEESSGAMESAAGGAEARCESLSALGPGAAELSASAGNWSLQQDKEVRAPPLLRLSGRGRGTTPWFFVWLSSPRVRSSRLNLLHTPLPRNPPLSLFLSLLSATASGPAEVILRKYGRKNEEPGRENGRPRVQDDSDESSPE